MHPFIILKRNLSDPKLLNASVFIFVLCWFNVIFCTVSCNLLQPCCPLALSLDLRIV